MSVEVEIRLDSWKEIATYLKRDVRTVRRWEVENGLPIHRIPGAQKVFAFSSELDAWLGGGTTSEVQPAVEFPPPVTIRRVPWPRWMLVALALLFVVAALLMVFSSPRWRQTTPSPRFSFARTDYPSPGGAWVAAADFNGDGRPDLLFVNAHSDSVSLMLNEGNGRFGSRRDIVVGRDPEVLALGDFNNDGWLDVVVSRFSSDREDNGVVVLLGDGAGGFRETSRWAIPSHSKGIAVGDFNRDGYLDFAVGMRDRLTIFLGHGDGTFARAAEILRPMSAVDLHAADLNRDGILDLVWANFGAGRGDRVSVALGKGDGTFQPPADYPVGKAPLGIAVGDLNHDGIPDIATANFVGNLTVLLGRGDGTFAPGRTFANVESVGTIAIADVDGDGNPDLIVLNLHAAAVSVLAGNGDGTFGAPVDFPVGRYPTAVAIADFDGDGKPDLAVSASIGDMLSVLMNSSRRTLSPRKR